MKKDLVRVCYYDIVGDGRVIIKQGHVGLSFYFIISGQVEVITNVKDEFGRLFGLEVFFTILLLNGIM